MIKKSVLLVLPASGFNEQEFLVISGAIEKANLNLFIASDSHSLCVGSEGLKVKNDVQLYNVHESNFAGLIFIGGKGVKDYWNIPSLLNIARKFNGKSKLIGAICSAAVIPAKAGVVEFCATCYPDDKKELERQGIQFKDEPVVQSKNIITGRDPLAASEFVKLFLHELSKKN